MSDPIPLREARIRAEGPTRRARLGASLAKVAQAAARDDIERSMTGYVVVLLTEEAPIVTFEGVSWVDLDDASAAVRDAREAARKGDADAVHRGVVDAWQRRQERVRRERDRVEAIREAHRWECEADGCTRKFKTQRGATQHERACPYFEATKAEHNGYVIYSWDET